MEGLGRRWRRARGRTEGFDCFGDGVEGGFGGAVGLLEVGRHGGWLAGVWARATGGLFSFLYGVSSFYNFLSGAFTLSVS